MVQGGILHDLAVVHAGLRGCVAFVPVGAEMTAAPTPQEVIEMLREEGIADLPEGFPVEGDLFAAGMDSMAVMQLIVIAEEKFGAVIAPQDADRENLGTPRDLAALIGRRQA
jgi:acyl carrier protein